MVYYIYKDKFSESVIELETELDKDFYINIGKTYEDYLNQNYVALSEDQVKFYKEHPEASIKEIWDMALKQVEEVKVEPKDRKETVLDMLYEFDQSENVNSFLVNGISAWFTVEQRNNYRISLDAAKHEGLTDISFFIGDNLFTVKVEDAEHMLAQVQLYADKCFIVTKQHEIAIKKLTDINEISNYDYKVGYPEKLSFNI